MKLDYELIKNIFKEVVEKSDGSNLQQIKTCDFPNNDEGKKSFMVLAHHFKILIDAGLISGNYGDKNPPVSINYTALTVKGKQTLEDIQNGNFKNTSSYEALEKASQ